MRSRILIGAAAWVLGAVAATSGSMLAVNSLAHGLLGSESEPLTQPTVSSALAGYQAHRSQQAGPRAGAATAGKVTGTGKRHHQTATDARRPAVPSRTDLGSAGSLLVSQAGSVMASCQSGLAYLQYWSPDQGYRADDLFRGPAPQASVVFESVMSEVQMRVTCTGSQPVAHLSKGN